MLFALAHSGTAMCLVNFLRILRILREKDCWLWQGRGCQAEGASSDFPFDCKNDSQSLLRGDAMPHFR